MLATGSRLVLLLLLGLQGCTAAYKSYPGPDLPDSEIAILEGYWHYYFVAVRVVKFDSIDGKPIFVTSGDATRVMLSPGRHTIGARVLSAFGEVGVSTGCTFEAAFEKGHHYRIVSFDLGASETHVSLEMKTTLGSSVTSRAIPCQRIDG